MKRFHTLIKRLFLPVLMATALSGCVGDRYTESLPAEEKDMYLLVELKVSGVSTSATRTFATDDDKEENINDLDVLAFKVNGSGDEIFAYHKQAVKLSDGSGSYRVPVEKSDPVTQQFRFVFLANLRSEVNAAKTANKLIASTTSKAVALAAITFNALTPPTPLETMALGWNVTTPYDLPMWGESEPTAVTSDLEDIGTVQMLRSMARVDILLNPKVTPAPIEPEPDTDIEGFGDLFEIEKVQVRNASYKGAAAPEEDNVFENAITNAMEVSAPTVPTTNTYDIEYTATGDQKKYGFVRDIYIAESAYTTDSPPGVKDDEDITCLLIGGSYNGGATTWYRLDFLEETGNQRMDVLRNHRYVFNITAINGPGLPNPDDALTSQPLNIEYVVGWNTGTMADVTIDQYTLSVSQGVFTLSGDEHYASDTGTDNVLTITSNPKKWKVDKIVDAEGISVDIDSPGGWLKVVKGDGTTVTEGTAGTTTVKLRLTENSPTATPVGGVERTGYIHLLAGTLTYKVKVTQSAKL